MKVFLLYHRDFGTLKMVRYGIYSSYAAAKRDAIDLAFVDYKIIEEEVFD